MCFSAADITRLASVCPRIQQLCLNIFDLAPGASEDFAGFHTKAYSDVVVPQTHFEAALGAIAKMPSHQTLRLPDPRIFRIGTDQEGDMAPGIDLWVAQGNQQLRFQALADGIMGYLAERGSKTKILAFSPLDGIRKSDSPDENGHSWPHYFYLRARLTDSLGSEQELLPYQLRVGS
jgi:hypothetical protein